MDNFHLLRDLLAKERMSRRRSEANVRRRERETEHPATFQSLIPVFSESHWIVGLEFTEFSFALIMCVCYHFSRVQLFVTLWTVAHQAPLSTGFSRQEYWSGLPCPPPGDLPDLGIKPASLSPPALAGEFCTTSAIWEALALIIEPSA